MESKARQFNRRKGARPIRILHVSPVSHPCFNNLIGEQSKVHSLVYVKLNLIDDERSYRIKRDRDGLLIENVKNSPNHEYDYKLLNIFNKILKTYRPELIHIQVFSGISLLPILNVASSLRIKKILTLHDHSLLCVRGICHNGQKICQLDSLLDCDCLACQQEARRRSLSLRDLNKLRGVLATRIIEQSDKIICPSHHQREQLVRLFGNQEKFVTLYYGTKPCRIPTKKEMHSKVTFGYLGTLWWAKGVSLIESAIDKLQDCDFNILMGLTRSTQEPTELFCLERLRSNKKIKIKLDIKKQRIYEDFFREIDYLIIPSVWNETGPMTLFEAFSCHVPVISFDAPALSEKIQENKNSMLFSDESELANIMANIIANKVARSPEAIFPFKNIRDHSREIGGVYKEALASTFKGLFLRLSLACNNQCVFCVTGPDNSNEHFDLKTIKNILKSSRSRYDRLVLTGGEPTLRKDFLNILDCAFKLGYAILLQTNGRLFAHEKFCEKIMNYNMKFSININGPTAQVHDDITKVPGSFYQTIRGIKNLQKFDSNILVKILLTQSNYKHLLKTAQFVAKLGIKDIWFVFLTPSGSARVNFNDVVPSFCKVASPLKKALLWLKKNTSVNISLEGFPHCCLDPEFFSWITETRFNEDSLDGLIPENNRQFYNCKHERVIRQKQKLNKCKNCFYDKECEGVYLEYLKRNGSSEFSPILKVGSQSKRGLMGSKTPLTSCLNEERKQFL